MGLHVRFAFKLFVSGGKPRPWFCVDTEISRGSELSSFPPLPSPSILAQTLVRLRPPWAVWGSASPAVSPDRREEAVAESEEKSSVVRWGSCVVRSRWTSSADLAELRRRGHVPGCPELRDLVRGDVCGRDA